MSLYTPFHVSFILLMVNQNTSKLTNKNYNLVCWPLSISPNNPISRSLQKLNNVLHIIIFIFPLGKFSNWLLFWNIKKGGYNMICHTTGQIFINPWKVAYENYHTYGTKWITLTHAYNCDLKIRKPSTNSTYLTFLLLPPLLSTNIIHFLVSKPPPKAT